jgi:hypothetical protein
MFGNPEDEVCSISRVGRVQFSTVIIAGIFESLNALDIIRHGSKTHTFIW